MNSKGGDTAYEGVDFDWRRFLTNLVMGVDSYSPSPVDLFGWNEPDEAMKRKIIELDEKLLS